MLICTECGRESEDFESDMKYHICEDCLVEID
jgi:NMD protein affecting ribosome stability and mRNA decay